MPLCERYKLRSKETRARVRELGLVDAVVDTNAEAVRDADLVILGIPVGACGAVAEEIAGHLKPGAIVSDVGSVKAEVMRDMAPHLPANVHFVGKDIIRFHAVYWPIMLKEMRLPLPSATARSTQFSSSRTLPGQS